LDPSLSGKQLYRRARKESLSDLSFALRPRGIVGGLFHKISENNFHTLITRAVKAFDHNLSSELETAVRKPLVNHEERVRCSANYWESQEKAMRNSIDNSMRDLKMQKEKLTALYNKCRETKASLSYCHTLLTQYIEIAQAEYTKEMEACCQKLQSPNISATEKAWVMILMGLMERDRIVIFNER
jgi:hypothetical protein